MIRHKLSEHVSTAFIYAGIGLMVGLLAATTIAIESGLPMAAFGRALISLGFVVLLALLLTAAMRAATTRPKVTNPLGTIYFIGKREKAPEKAEQEKAFRKVGEGLADFHKRPERYPDAEEPPQPWMVGLTRKQHAEFRAAMDGPGDLVALVTTMRRANYDRIMARAARGDAPLVCMNHDGKWVDESAINWLRISMDEAAHIARVAAIKADQRAKSTFESTYGVNDSPAAVVDVTNLDTIPQGWVLLPDEQNPVKIEPWMVGLEMGVIDALHGNSAKVIQRIADDVRNLNAAICDPKNGPMFDIGPVMRPDGSMGAWCAGCASGALLQKGGMSDDARFEAGDLPVQPGTHQDAAAREQARR